MIRKLFGGAVALFALLCCSQAFAESQCVTAGLNSACGYDCKTSGLNAKCAKTPAGACISVGTEIECWDPPYRTRRKAECISSGRPGLYEPRSAPTGSQPRVCSGAGLSSARCRRTRRRR